MKGVNVKLNYNQSVTECRDKLVDLCNKWEMDDSDKDTMTLEVALDALSKPNIREKVREYISELDAEYDRCMDWIEEHMNGEARQVYAMEMKAKTLMEVKNDLESRLEELI